MAGDQLDPCQPSYAPRLSGRASRPVPDAEFEGGAGFRASSRGSRNRPGSKTTARRRREGPSGVVPLGDPFVEVVSGTAHWWQEGRSGTRRPPVLTHGVGHTPGAGQGRPGARQPVHRRARRPAGRQQGGVALSLPQFGPSWSGSAASRRVRAYTGCPNRRVGHVEDPLVQQPVEPAVADGSVDPTRGSRWPRRPRPTAEFSHVDPGGSPGPERLGELDVERGPFGGDEFAGPRGSSPAGVAGTRSRWCVDDVLGVDQGCDGQVGVRALRRCRRP